MRKNILFYIGSLHGGGAERVLIELLKNLNRDKYHLYLAINRPEGFFFNQIPEDVIIVDRSYAYQSPFRLFDRYFGLSNIIKNEQIDIAMSFLPGANRSLMRSVFFKDPRVKFLLNEQNNPSYEDEKKIPKWKLPFTDYEARWLYPKADKLIVSCNGLREHFVKEWSLQENLVHAIYNPIDIKRINLLSIEPVINQLKPIQTEYTMIAAGRLTRQKNYFDMLEVLKRVRQEIPAKLIILGEGPEREQIEQKISELDLNDHVWLPGFVPNPWAWMKQADIYVSTSYYEGFHLTIAEAMACGTVPVVTDCDFGPREIINDGVNGRLLPVGDVNTMTDTIIKLLENENQRKRMSEEAFIRAYDFDTSKIIKQYEALFDQVLINGEYLKN